MQKRKIKAIIFDLGGVVAHGGYLDFLKHYCLKCLTPRGKKLVSKLEHEVNLGKISEKEFYRKLQAIFDVHLSAKRMHDLIAKKMTFDKELVKFIPHLKRSKVVMFTNSIGHIASEVLGRDHKKVKKLFERVFDSNKIHLAKPDPKAYRYIMKKLKVRPAETLLVDDRLENILPARKIGMQGIVYKSASQFKKAIRKYGYS